jgi:hypothetical protein
MTTRVVNCTGGNRNYDVYIGNRIRFHSQKYPQSKWGNPYSKYLKNWEEIGLLKCIGNI